MRYHLSGTSLPILTVALDAGEALFSQIVAMLWMEAGIAMTTNGRRGLFGGFKDPDDEEPFTVEYEATAAASLAFAPHRAGTIVPVTLGAGEHLICRRDTLLCAARPMATKTIWESRLSGRHALIMLRLTGPGTLFLAFAGETVERDLAPGESLRVPADHVAVLDPTIVITVELVPGFRNALQEVNGLHLATLTGPGRITLQSMPPAVLAEDIVRLLPDHPD